MDENNKLTNGDIDKDQSAVADPGIFAGGG
jgi:hypothetical protein